ncbi:MULTISPECIES: SDR family oxidoreductase [Bartonella]|uniref:SDR family oxidoreductase n=1 Tax=Bartonella TaxID=773 RepID=UPI0018DBFAE6|nr:MULTISPECIES: SDR family oxidoreductase [Bartonella]MBH9975188.1 SDR family oxidoreductase [Bartonella choladocola]MBI0014794.1 SDR family oxidoreductase [Bartonella sp. B10834G3]
MEKRRPVVLITGGAKRLGAAMALDLAANGFDLAIHYNEARQEADALLPKLEASGAKALSFQSDLLKTHGRGLVETVTEKMGPVEILVNNASLFLDDGIGALDMNVWDNHFAIHVKTPALLADRMFVLLPENLKGLIVNIIDQRVLKLNPNFLSYTLSKSTLWTLTKTLAQALAPRVRVNAIGPGPTLKSSRQDEDDFVRQAHSVLLEHGPDLAEFGATIRYFWCQTSITGQMIALDGGQHLMWQTPDIAGRNE